MLGERLTNALSNCTSLPRECACCICSRLSSKSIQSCVSVEGMESDLDSKFIQSCLTFRVSEEMKSERIER